MKNVKFRIIHSFESVNTVSQILTLRTTGVRQLNVITRHSSSIHKHR